ncbi:MAG: MaoC family dehydratase N-terminal domain-containing protein [Pseudomonadota bacterium]
MTDLNEWIGRAEERLDLITPAPVRALAATLDHDDATALPGEALPPLWHWLYFLPMHRQAVIGADGHPARGGFLPPVDLPRRMWAGGRLKFLRPLRIGDAVLRVSRITDVSKKEGRSGSLAFIQVRHEIRNDRGLAITEEHDIVYRNHPLPGDPVAEPVQADNDWHWMRDIVPDPVLLFRYSALTFNGHRIHYDLPYATQVEGYPGLVVHGPLVATLLLDLLHRNWPAAEVAEYSFRAMQPLFHDKPFQVCGRVHADGKTVSLWARNEQGHLSMRAEAILNKANNEE